MLFAFFFIIETAGLSLEEVDELYATTTPIKSTAANKEVRARRAELEGEASAYPKGDEEAAADEAKREVVAKTADQDEKASF